jgi:hypothetical protein
MGGGSVDGRLTTGPSIDDLNKHCLEEFTQHWKCLDNHNQQMWQCRPFEWKLNKCAFDSLVRTPSLCPQIKG